MLNFAILRGFSGTRRYALSLTLALGACGGDSSMPSPPPPPVAAPAITQQPQNASIPMGLSAAFSVSATGSSLSYQWSKNGTPIAEATSNAYTTPPAAFTDSGAVFAVTVSNKGGSVGSSNATLKVTARAPAQNDLRFQHVDSPATVNGWGSEVGISTFLPGRGAAYYAPSIGTPFYVGAANCANPPVNDGLGCEWAYTEIPFAASAAEPEVIAAYGGDSFDNFAVDFAPGNAGSLFNFDNAVSPLSPASVINALDIEPLSNLFAIAWTQLGSPSTSPQVAPFVLLQRTLAPEDIAAAAAADAAAGWVITAISANGSDVTYFAYSWQGDASARYEVQVATATAAEAPAAGAQLAAAGYIITAAGLSDASGDIFLVGTRVAGDTAPRPLIIAQTSSDIAAAQKSGYANVAIVAGPSGGSTAYFYER
jgi:hypothetical protein